MKKQFLFSLLALSVAAGAKADEARLLRFPATNGTDVVFSYAGDLYTAPLTGGDDGWRSAAADVTRGL